MGKTRRNAVSSSTTGRTITGSVAPGGVVFSPSAAAVGFGSAEGAEDDGCRATDARLDFDRAGGAVPGARTALHASIAIGDFDLPVLQTQNPMGAYFDTSPTPAAFLAVCHQADNGRQVTQCGHGVFHHLQAKRPAIHSATPPAVATTCRGTAMRISRRTPESDV